MFIKHTSTLLFIHNLLLFPFFIISSKSMSQCLLITLKGGPSHDNLERTSKRSWPRWVLFFNLIWFSSQNPVRKMLLMSKALFHVLWRWANTIANSIIASVNCRMRNIEHLVNPWKCSTGLKRIFMEKLLLSFFQTQVLFFFL